MIERTDVTYFVKIRLKEVKNSKILYFGALMVRKSSFQKRRSCLNIIQAKRLFHKMKRSLKIFILTKARHTTIVQIVTEGNVTYLTIYLLIMNSAVGFRIIPYRYRTIRATVPVPPHDEKGKKKPSHRK